MKALAPYTEVTRNSSISTLVLAIVAAFIMLSPAAHALRPSPDVMHCLDNPNSTISEGGVSCQKILRRWDQMQEAWLAETDGGKNYTVDNSIVNSRNNPGAHSKNWAVIIGGFSIFGFGSYVMWKYRSRGEEIYLSEGNVNKES